VSTGWGGFVVFSICDLLLVLEQSDAVVSLRVAENVILDDPSLDHHDCAPHSGDVLDAMQCHYIAQFEISGIAYLFVAGNSVQFRAGYGPTIKRAVG
jgi:hypothetical protein